MEQEFLEYLDAKFTRLEDKVSRCAQQEPLRILDERLWRVQQVVGTHSLIFTVVGAVSLAALAAWFSGILGK